LFDLLREALDSLRLDSIAIIVDPYFEEYAAK
jgi:hypothetical protein